MAQTLCPAQATGDTEAQGCPSAEEASHHRELCLMRKRQAPGRAPSGPPAGARGSTNWAPATLSQGQEAGRLRAGGSRAQKGEPPSRQAAPSSTLTAASRASCLGVEHLQSPLSLVCCLISSPGEQLTPSQPNNPCTIPAALDPPAQAYSQRVLLQPQGATPPFFLPH